MLDNIDLKIIEMVSNNASTPVSGMSKRLKLTEGAVRRRIKTLEEKRVIVDYKARIRYALMDRTFMIVGLDVAPEKFSDVITAIKETEGVKEAYTTSGDHSLIFMAEVNSQETNGFLSGIKKIDGIRNVYPALVQDIIK